MTDLRQLNNGALALSVDTSIYDDWVIDKVLYWWSAEYVITRKNTANSRIQEIILEAKPECKIRSFQAIKEKLSNDFIDYKNRQTIAKETANIRDLLFAKAFANSDDFVEFTFKD